MSPFIMLGANIVLAHCAAQIPVKTPPLEERQRSLWVCNFCYQTFYIGSQGSCVGTIKNISYREAHLVVGGEFGLIDKIRDT